MTSTREPTTQPEPVPAAQAPATGEGQMPPGPRLPRVVQTAGFMLGGVRFLDSCRRRYGNAVTFSTLFDDRFVMVFDPELVKQVFQGSNAQLHAGEANALLGPIVGERSVLLLDGAEHLRHRKLMLPAFHGRQMLAHTETMRACADLEIDSWPVGEPFAVLPSMQSLTLRVILRAVFGYETGPAEAELRGRLRAMLDPLARPRGMVIMRALLRRRPDPSTAVQAFEERRKAVDEIIYDEIARRRQEPDLDQRDDVFSALLLARDEQGEPLTDREVRDELLTLLLAGHETTANGLAWTIDMLLHDQRALDVAKRREERYLDAVVKEALRIRPVIPAVGRVALNGYEVPVGVEINPSIRTIHRRPDLYPSPGMFWPERFLGDDPPDTYTWLPFGGGTRRCLGASFAQTEMRIVLERVLARAELKAADPERAKGQLRAITLSPKGGVRVVQERAPLPAP
jgi:cytochrome P450